jgi:hypothetical protein
MKSIHQHLFRQICVVTCLSVSILLLIISVSNAQKHSVFTRIPSDVADRKGIAVRIDMPKIARYENDSAPIAIYLPGGFKAAGIEDRTAQLVREGFIEIRFNFQGSGRGRHVSGGNYDYRGQDSLKALRDVIQFALGLVKDIGGKNIPEIVKPFKPLHSNGLDWLVLRWCH